MNYDETRNDMKQQMDECIQNCLDCFRTCLETVPHCLNLGGVHAAQDHITMLLECADVCQTSARLMLLQSALHTEQCGICAKVCERCDDDCQSMADGDEQMIKCAEACRRCAETCKEMASMSTMS